MRDHHNTAMLVLLFAIVKLFQNKRSNTFLPMQHFFNAQKVLPWSTILLILLNDIELIQHCIVCCFRWQRPWQILKMSVENSMQLLEVKIFLNIDSTNFTMCVMILWLLWRMLLCGLVNIKAVTFQNLKRILIDICWSNMINLFVSGASLLRAGHSVQCKWSLTGWGSTSLFSLFFYFVLNTEVHTAVSGMLNFVILLSLQK